MIPDAGSKKAASAGRAPIENLGLYFHIPFCRSKCGYCSFVSGTDFSKMPEYHKSILENVDLYSTLFQKKLINSIYFGGGTPSVYFNGGIADILSAVRRSFRLSDDCEITAEANPESLTRGKAAEWAAAGINRVSVGMQSADDKTLALIGRPHKTDDFFKAYEAAVCAGIRNISADIMLGLPGQTINDIEKTIKVLYKLPYLRHLSVYALKLEPGTPMFSRFSSDCMIRSADNNGSSAAVNKALCVEPPLPDEDLAADMYDAAHKLLVQAGFLRYEVSNFAVPGFECRHNLKYWDLDKYLGIGVAAHSFYGGKRYAETDDIDKFIAGQKPVCFALNPEDIHTEYIMLKSRLENGIDLNEFKQKFGYDLAAAAGAGFLIRHGLILIESGRLKIAPGKFYVMNSIILKLLE